MKQSLLLLVAILLFSCKAKKVAVEPDYSAQVKKINEYANYINLGSKDVDTVQVKFDKKSYAFKEANIETFSTFLKDKILKIKERDYLENNFVKLKSFYFKNDSLVFIKVDEVFHKKDGTLEKYRRGLYYDGDLLMKDTKRGDTKYLPKQLKEKALILLGKEYKKKGK